MTENLRTRLKPESTLIDVARAIKTSFEIDAYDLGVLWAIRYNPDAIELYKNQGLVSEEFPHSIFYSKIGHSLSGEFADLNQELQTIAQEFFLPNKREEASRKGSAIRQDPRKVCIIYEQTKQTMDKMMDELRRARDGKMEFKPAYLEDSLWAPRNKYGISGEGFHDFANAWGQRLYPIFGNEKRYLAMKLQGKTETS